MQIVFRLEVDIEGSRIHCRSRVIAPLSSAQTLTNSLPNVPGPSDFEQLDSDAVSPMSDGVHFFGETEYSRWSSCRALFCLQQCAQHYVRRNGVVSYLAGNRSASDM